MKRSMILVAAIICGNSSFGDVSWTPDEKAWLLEHPTIRVGVDPDWPPFTSYREDGVLVGIDADLLQELEARLGVRMDVVRTRSWETTWEEFVAGEIDVTTATSVTEGRADIAVFTDPYVSFPVAVITRQDAPFLLGLRGLVGKIIAAPARHVTTEQLKKDYPNVELLFTSSSLEAMTLVAQSKADVAVENLAIASHIIRRNGLTNLKIAGLTDYHFDLRFAVRKDWAILGTILDKAVADIPVETKNRSLDRWIPLDYAEAINWQSVWRGVQWVVAFALVLLVSAFLWNRRLAHELRQREIVEAKLRERETEIRKNNELLTRLNAEKDLVMKMAAHDLNNPLAAIIMTAESLERHLTGMTPNDRADLAAIRESAMRMSRLVRSLLQMGALDQDPSRIRISEVNVARCLSRVVNRSRALASPKNITIGFEEQKAPAPIVRGNDDALDQVFDNLISNAVKFTPPGSSVAVRMLTHDGLTRVEVKDQGPGVKSEDMPRLFGAFARLSAEPTGGEISTGLGLAIVKKLIEAMHGKVWCESSEGHGATFIVEFPPAPGETSG